MSNQRDKLNDRENLITIIQACEKIISYTEEIEWDDFSQRGYIVDACAMNCLVIGERAAKLSHEFKEEYNGLPWIELENFRHRAAHTYGTDTFDIGILWSTIVTDIPEALEYCLNVLDDYDSRGGIIRSMNKRRIFRRG